jgi:hypothetical protein
MYWGWDLPQIARNDHIEALGELIQANHIDAAIIDPAYLALLAGDTQGRQASNIFDMGSLLINLTTVGQQTGATIILIHHCRKSTLNPGAPPELEDLSMAGFAEWARQWLLIGRRDEYEKGSGIHRLWLNVGGSAGHSGCYAIDVDEGILQADFSGRKWEVAVTSPDHARSDAERRTANKRAKRQEDRENDHCRRLLEVMRTIPREGETAKVIREQAGLNPAAFGKSITGLLQTRNVVKTTIKKASKEYDAYQLFEGERNSGTV